MPDFHKITFTACETQALSSLFPNEPKEAIDLLDRLLSYDPTKRIKAKEALEHPYFHIEPFPLDAIDLTNIPLKEATKHVEYDEFMIDNEFQSHSNSEAE